MPNAPETKKMWSRKRKSMTRDTTVAKVGVERAKATTTRLVNATKQGNAISDASSNRPPEAKRTLRATNIFPRKASGRKDVACVVRWTTMRVKLGHNDRQRAVEKRGSNFSMLQQQTDTRSSRETLCILCVRLAPLVWLR